MVCDAPAVCEDEPVTTKRVAAPGVPVAVKVTGDPDSDPDVAVTVFEPAVVPSVHVPAVAMPLLFVVAFAPVMDPPPDATANVTVTPLTGLPAASVTRTAGDTLTADPAVADCPLPAFTAIDAAAPGPVGVIVAVTEVRPVAAKVRVVADDVLPANDRPENVATPETAATLVVPDSVPAPAVTVTVFVAVVTVLSFASVTRITGCVVKVAPDAPAAGAVTTRSFVAEPATNDTEAVEVSALPASVPDTVAVPAVVDEVSVAEYVPLLLFVTADKVPRVVDSTTVPPETVRLLPNASLSCTVIADVEVPFAVMDDVAAVIVDSLRLTGPGAVVNVPDAEDVVTVDELTVPDALMT